MANAIDSMESVVSPPRPGLRKAAGRWLPALLISLLGLGSEPVSQAQDQPANKVKNDERIAARGRIEPVSRVLVLAAPAGSILEQVAISQGDQVKTGQLLAQTSRRQALRASVVLAEQRLAEARIGLKRAKAPAKQADRDAQQAVVDQRQAELDQATDAYRKAQEKKGKKKPSTQELEGLERAEAAADRALRQAQATLRSLSETRQIDIEAAASQVKVAEAQLETARAEQELAEVRAPMEGTILQLNARAGESTDGRGLLRMADLSRLMVIAEVDQRDIAKVEVGERTQCSGGVLTKPITGKVVRIGQLVSTPQRPTSDLLNGLDARVVEVEVRTDSALPTIIGGEVDVLIPAP